MKPCDIKDSNKAWNDGIDAFKKAFKQTGGKTTESIKFAVDEINKQNPDFKFDVDSFVNPLMKSLKEKSLVSPNYSFKKNNTTEGKINKITEKMSTMSSDQKKAFGRKSFAQFQKDGMLTEDKVKNIYSEAIGIPAMNDKVQEQIKKTSAALTKEKEVEDEIKAKIKELQADKDTAEDKKLSPEKDKLYTEIFNNLADRRKKAKDSTMKESAAFAEMLKEKKFWLHQLTDYMPLNLMNPNSLMKNVSGAFADAFVRTVGNSMASPVSEMAKFATGINSNPMFAKVKGAIKSKAFEKGATAWKYGQTDFNSEIPQTNHLSAANRFRQAMDTTGAEKFKGILSALLKVHPNLISKGLTVPDAMVYEAVYSSEMNRMAESKGLKGSEKQAFLLDPDEKSDEVATKLAEAATFKQDLPDWASGIKKLSAYDAHEQTKKLIDKGMSPMAAKIQTGLRSIVQKSAVPFIKTPINIVRTASKILLPEYEFASSMIKAKNETDATERQRLIIEGSTKAVAGFLLRNVAFQLIAQGLISAGYDDEDKKTKDFVEQEAGGPNRVNFSAMIRAMTFQDTVKKQKGDTYVDLSALGATGIAMAVYAHAYNKQSKDDIENHTQYNKNLMNTVSIPWDLTWSTLSSTLDFTFFTGVNQLQGAVLNRGEYERNQVTINYISNLFTGVLPATYQKFSMQSSEEVKKQFDKELPFHENLVNALGYRFFFHSDELKNKYFSLAEKDKGALKKKHHMLFDNYAGRVLESEIDFGKLTKSPDGDNPISRLYDASREVEKEDRDKLFPSSISQNQTIEGVKRGRKQTYKVNLTDDQYNYLQSQASTYRMIMATPFIMSDDFKKFDYETKTKVLQNLYQDGLKAAKKDLQKVFPDIQKQKIEGIKENRSDVKSITKKYKTKELK